MAMDMGALYGEAVASFLFHGCLVFLAVMAADSFEGAAKYIVFIATMAAGSFLINGGLLTVLHQLTCSGVKNVAGILKGAGVSAVLAAGMPLLAFFVEPLRLVISQMVITHRYLGTPARVDAEAVLKGAATQVHDLAAGKSIAPEVLAPLTGEGVGSLPADLYAAQTRSETAWAASYLAAFAGAYGIALGAQWTSQCGA